MADSSPKGVDLLANADMSPSTGYAAINTGVDAAGKRIVTPTVPLVQSNASNLPLTHLLFDNKAFNKLDSDAMRDIFNIKPAHRSNSWKGSDEHIIHDTNATKTLTTTAQSAGSTCKENIDINNVVESVSKNLQQDNDFLYAIGQKLVKDHAFCQSVTTQVREQQNTGLQRPLGSFAQRYLFAVQFLPKLCSANRLPAPKMETVSTTDINGNVTFHVTMKVGHEGKNVFTSQKCNVLQDAVIEVTAKALQSLEDLGLSMEDGPDTSDVLTAATTTHNRLADTNDQTPANRAQAQLQSSRPGLLQEQLTDRNGDWGISEILGNINKTDGQNRIKNLKLDTENETDEYWNDYWNAFGAIDNSNLVKDSLSEARGQKRSASHLDIDDNDDDNEEEEIERPKPTLAVLMGRLAQVPVTDGEGRLSVICHYLAIGEPTLERMRPARGSPYFVARMWLPHNPQVAAHGQTIDTVFQRLAAKTIARLRTIDFNVFDDELSPPPYPKPPMYEKNPYADDWEEDDEVINNNKSNLENCDNYTDDNGNLIQIKYEPL